MGELKSAFFWRSVLVEFAASFLFLFALCSLTVTLNPKVMPSDVKLALGTGLAFAVLVQVFRPASGAHINPIVSFAMMITRKVSILKGCCYMGAQYAGAVAGAGLCFTLTPSSMRGWLGVVRIHSSLTTLQGFVIEMMLSIMVVLVVFASLDTKRNEQGFGPALAVGLSYAVSHFVGYTYTGSSVNPARAFATAMTIDDWPTHHWVFWLAPVVGAAIAGIFYVFIVEPQATEENGNDEKCCMQMMNKHYVENGTANTYQEKSVPR